LERRKRVLEKRITSILFKDVCARTAELLVDFVEKYGVECPEDEHKSSRDVVLTHQEVADFVGAARPVISSVISDMLKADILHKHSKALCVRDIERLKSLAEHGIKAFSRMG
jgi:CRP-like cAMP-binding protein